MVENEEGRARTAVAGDAASGFLKAGRFAKGAGDTLLYDCRTPALDRFGALLVYSPVT
jgi:hypothetical protein